MYAEALCTYATTPAFGDERKPTRADLGGALGGHRKTLAAARLDETVSRKALGWFSDSTATRRRHDFPRRASAL
jgi:hypothetical protein